MIVCDLCKSEKCFRIEIPVIKVEKKKKTMIIKEMDLCDPCITKFLRMFGGWTNSIRGKDESPSEASSEKENGKVGTEEESIEKAT